MADIKVRQAMNKVIDRQDIIDKVYAGEEAIYRRDPFPPAMAIGSFNRKNSPKSFTNRYRKKRKAMHERSGFCKWF